MELRHLRYFTVLAETLNFTAAARAVHVTQSTLSHQIRQLEEEVGHRLFERSSRSVALTKAGERLLPGIRRALGEIDEAMRTLKTGSGELTGAIRILVGTHTFGVGILPACLERFLAEQPSVRVSAEEALAVGFLDRLRDNPFDLVVGAEEESPDFAFEPLYAEELGLAVSRKHPLARRRKIRMTELHQLPMVLLTREDASRRTIDDCFARIGAAPKIVAEVTMIDSLFQVSRRTDLATVVGRNFFENKEIVFIPLEDPTPVRTLGLFWRRDAQPAPEVARFAEVVRQTVAALAADRSGWPRIHSLMDRRAGNAAPFGPGPTSRG